MTLPQDLALKISKTTVPNNIKETGGMVVVIQRPYAHLEKEMRKTFCNEKQATVIIDRRMGERRCQAKPVENDRRQRGRRTPKELLLELVISP